MNTPVEVSSSMDRQRLNIRLLNRFYGVFLVLLTGFLLIGVPFVFERKLVSAVLCLSLLVSVFLARRISRRGAPEKSLLLFSSVTWFVLVGLVYAGLPPITSAFCVAVAVMLAIVVDLRIGWLFGGTYLAAWLGYNVLDAMELAPPPYFPGPPLTTWLIGAFAMSLMLLPIPELVNRVRDVAQHTQAILDNALDGIITIDEQGIVVSFNGGAERVFGFAMKEVVGRNIKMLMPEPYHGQHDDYLHRYVSSGARRVLGTTREVIGQRKNGEAFPMDLSVTEFSHEGRRLFIGSVRDISERKHAEAVQAEYAEIVESSNDAIMAKTLDGIVTSWNLAAERIFGYKKHEILGRPMALLIMPDHVDEEQQILDKIRRGERVEQFETVRRRKDGNIIPVSITVSPIKDRSGTIVGASKIARDISERKEAERLKSEFVSTISHELRTPLTSIRGALGLVTGKFADAMPDSARQLLETANRNSQRLATLINDILDMEKMAAGKLQIVMEEQELMPLVEEALIANHGYAAEHQVHFVLTERVDGVKVRVDRERVGQALSNYLSNAAKFSPQQANVEIGVRQIGEQARVSVRDFGPGVPAKFRARIFEKFFQADSSATRQRGGTGLGLAITRELVERMGGKAGFESVEGEGATFFFDLPVCEPALVRAQDAA